jgi:hypothetical protein
LEKGVAMDNQEIDKLLEQLHKEIDEIESDDEKGQELLRELSSDIRELLERAEAKQAEPSMLDRLEDSIDYFSVTHPEFTTALSNLSRILSNAGI